MGNASMWFCRLFRFNVQDSKMQQQPKAGWRFGRRSRRVDADARHAIRGVDTRKLIANAVVLTDGGTAARMSLTNNRKGCSRRIRIILWIRRCAAVAIQKYYRGHLAKRAFRALKGLVRLQAIVRGYIVRKKSVELAVRFESLFCAQARAKLLRTRGSQLAHGSHARLEQSNGGGPLQRRNGLKSNVGRASDLDNTLNHPNCNNSSSFGTSNQPITGLNHLVLSNSHDEIQPVVHFIAKEPSPFNTPISSPMMYYSSSDDSDFNNSPGNMSSKAKRKLSSVPKQRKKTQRERLGKSKRHLVYDETPPSSNPNIARKVDTLNA